MKTKKIFFAAIGFIDDTGKQIAEFFGELEDRGRLLRNNSEDNAVKLVDKALGKPRNAAKIAGEILRDAFDGLGLATAADIEAIRDRLSRIEDKIEALKKKNKGQAKRTTGE
jgi:polyhydroxyalkanoate synthesis regulator phasin